MPYEIAVHSIIDGPPDSGYYTLLGEGLKLPADDEKIREMMAGLSITEERRPFTAFGYSFRMDALNGTVTGERRLDELNRFANYLSTLTENERDQLTRYANFCTRLTPIQCMTETPSFHNVDTREITIAVISQEYNTVPSVGYLHLPATAEEFIDAFDRVHADDCCFYIEPLSFARSCLKEPLRGCDDLFGMNHLAERLAGMDKTDSLFFEAMVKMEKEPPDVARLINLTHNLHNCVMAPEHNLTGLGKFAVQNNFYSEYDIMPDTLLDTLDYETIGRNFKEEQGGVFVDGCFIANLADENEMVSPYNGKPPIPDLKPDRVFRLTLEYSPENDPIYLDLPASLYDMKQAAQKLGKEDLTDCHFVRCESAIPQINKAFTGNENIYELSDFSETLQCMRNNGDLPKYKAALEVTPCACLDDFVALAAEDLERYGYSPYTISAFDYGEQEMLRLYKLDHTCFGMEHFDFAAFGSIRMEDNNVFSTPYGMICKPEAAQEITQEDGQGMGQLL